MTVACRRVLDVAGPRGPWLVARGPGCAHGCGANCGPWLPTSERERKRGGKIGGVTRSRRERESVCTCTCTWGWAGKTRAFSLVLLAVTLPPPPGSSEGFLLLPLALPPSPFSFSLSLSFAHLVRTNARMHARTHARARVVGVALSEVVLSRPPP